jgi:hypothetical protein
MAARAHAFCHTACMHLQRRRAEVNDADECVIAASEDNLAAIVEEGDGVDVVRVYPWGYGVTQHGA